MTSLSYSPRHLLLLLQDSSTMKQLKKTQGLLTKSGLVHHQPLTTKLISLSALSSWGNLHYARRLFDEIPGHLQSPSQYNCLIRAYSTSIFPSESIHLYNRMCRAQVPAAHFTFPFLLKACGRSFSASVDSGNQIPPFGFAQKGCELHSRAFRLGIIHNSFVQNSLMFMYSQCGNLDGACKIFEEMVYRTPVSWNTLMAAYDRHGDRVMAERLFRQMPERNVTSWNSMITMHVRAGDVRAARRVFEEMPEKDAISWNSMIAGYVRFKRYKCALELFRQMQGDEMEPTELTIVSVLGACAETGELEMGKEIHRYLKNKDIMIEGYVGNALLDMYAKCGCLKLAWQVFSGMSLKHITCWNAMIVGLAVHGCFEEALELFASMEREPSRVAEPNRITFLGVLLACSHKGLVKEGQAYFKRMVEKYKIEPDIKHYGCMVDLLCRCGMVKEAYQMIKDMPVKANSVLWKTVLAACRVYGHMELAKEALKERRELGPLGDDEIVTISNICADAERWEDVENLRTKLIGCSISKQAGYSQIELS
ncbi:pentatricopeptide repeat-containing protein At5g15300-like [Typha angustifolia]|uniref:pentatricopeptide repeat-containing protein At5g15300-like n=1 Tax=Typha angustifolia TaxID=59011 RepID=UPI003C2BB738